MAVGVEDRVAGARLLHAAHVGDDVADLAAAELVGLHLAELVVADLGDFVHLVRAAPKVIFMPGRDRAVDDAHARDGAAIAVVVRIEDQRAERRVRIALGRRHALHDRLEQLGDAEPFLGAHEQDVVGVGADQVVHFLLAALGLGAGKVDLVEDRDDLEPGVEREEEIRQRLRLDALRRVDDEDRALARGERARHLVREVDVPRRVDEVELVVSPVLRRDTSCGRR